MKTLFTLFAASLCLGQAAMADTGVQIPAVRLPSQPGVHGSSRTGESVLVIRDYLPWGGDVVPFFLAANTVVTEITTASIASTDLSSFCMVFVTAGTCEPFSLTSIRLNNARTRFTNYLEGGGTMLYQTGTWGATMVLPYMVWTSQQYESWNTFTGVNGLSSGMPFPEFDGSFASHDILNGLPDNADTLITTMTGEPTAVTYPAGAGHILVLTQPMEAYVPGGSNFGFSPHMMTLEENAIAFARYLGNCGDPVDAQDTPVAFDLMGNYPNPFNPITTISFKLPETAMVDLSVFNLAGERVSTLINGLTERGEHHVSFSADGLGSGLYLYRMEALGQVKSGRMLLVK